MTGNKLEDLNSTNLEKNKEQKRDNWDNPIEFLFSCISITSCHIKVRDIAHKHRYKTYSIQPVLVHESKIIKRLLKEQPLYY